MTTASGPQLPHPCRRAFIDLAFGLLILLAGLCKTFAAEAPGFATVQALRGEVLAGQRQLKTGDVLHVGERIVSTANGEALLQTRDAALIALRPNAEFQIIAYQAEGRPDDHMLLSLVKGGLRVITGFIATLNREEYRIATPVATIGVRGTDHEPYVLLNPAGSDLPGSYDKVNSGSTRLANTSGEVLVQAGRVGFVPSAPKRRGLLTLLLPRLLELVPGFYLGGSFDAEMDAYAPTAAEAAAAMLAQRQAQVPACEPAETVARNWLARFDAAVQRRDAAAVLALFADEATVLATVRDVSGALVSHTLNRQALADSAIASAGQLEHYQQQRLSLQASALPELAKGEDCARITLLSSVVEQGRMAGKPYRFESDERYVLARRGGRWLAVQAAATQR